MTALRPRRPRPSFGLSAPSPGRRPPGIAIDLGSSRTRAWTGGRGAILDVRTVTFPGSGSSGTGHGSGAPGGPGTPSSPGTYGTSRPSAPSGAASAPSGTPAGTSYPVQRGAIVDPEGTARMLERLLARHLPLLGRTTIALTTPVLGGDAYRAAAREALQVLRPSAILTIPTARAIALGAAADPSRPLLIVDVGGRLTEVFLLADGEVADAHRTDLGTEDVDDPACRVLTESVVGTVTRMLRSDGASLTREALDHGVLLAGGGALRPEIAHGLSERLHAAVRTAPAPHTVAVRGAARHLETVRDHPPGRGTAGPPTPQR